MVRRRRRLPILAVLIGLLVLLPVLAVGAGVVFVQSDAFKARIAARVQQATGRALSMRGAVSIIPGWSPAISAEDVALANVPGGSRPDMAKVRRVEASIAVLPLLSGRIELNRLVLFGPDILLETSAAGDGNWHMTPAARPAPAAAPAGTTGETAGSADRTPVQLSALHVRDGRITWRNGRTGGSTALDIPRLSLSSYQIDSNVLVQAETRVGDRTVTWTGRTASWARLQQGSAEAPWDVALTGTAGSASLAIAGGVRDPLSGQGYDIHLDATLPDLSSMSGVAGFRLPPLQGVKGAARIYQDPAGAPAVADVRLHADPSKLDDLAPGLQITRADISAATMADPIAVDVLGLIGENAAEISGHAGTIGAVTGEGPIPLDLALRGGGATATLKGAVARAATLAGVDLTFTGDAPNLAALSGLAGRPLPELRPASLHVHLTDTDGGLRHGFRIDGVKLALGTTAAEGEGSARLDGRAAFTATIRAQRIDADPLLQAFAGSPTAAPASPPPQAAATHPAEGPRRVIPDTELHLAGLKQADADLTLTAAEVATGGASYRDVTAHLVLKDGRLTLDPLRGQTPGGPLDVKLSVDAQATPPVLAVTAHAPALALQPLLTAFRLPDDASGTLDVDADLRAAGADLRALAAGTEGHVGLAMTDGELDNRMLAELAGPLLRGVSRNADAALLDTAGRTRVRCLAARVDAAHGAATVSASVLDTPRLLIQGAGTVNLTDEGLALRVRPTFRVGGPGLIVPVRIGGTLADPKVTVDATGTAESVAGLAATLSSSSGGGALAGLAAAAAGTPADACGPALAVARGSPPPAAQPAAAPPPPPRAPNGKPPKPADILRSLLR